MQPALPSTADPNARLLKILKAPPEQQTLIDRVLAGEKPFPHHRSLDGPLLLGMGASAKLLGVSRGTLWRMIRCGRLKKVEILPGSFRIRQRDLERFVAGRENGSLPSGNAPENGNDQNQERSSH